MSDWAGLWIALASVAVFAGEWGEHSLAGALVKFLNGH